MDREKVLKRLATFVQEECSEQAFHAAIERALERVVTGAVPERLTIGAGDVLAPGASIVMDDGRLWLDAFYDALLFELLRLSRPH